MSWFHLLVSKTKSDAVEEAVVIVPFPPLVSLLEQHEAANGSPLTEEQVLRIRDGAVCMTMSRSRAEQLAESRGFPDIDPANAWSEWVRVRSRGPA
jgi:hypothetical protein